MAVLATCLLLSPAQADTITENFDNGQNAYCLSSEKVMLEVFKQA